MTDTLNHLPKPCQSALAALERDPLDLDAPTRTHLHACPSCAEARVQWLAQEDFSPALAPAGYFEHLPDRVLRKLPTKPKASNAHPFLWAAAAMLLGAATLGGFLAGRANRTPVVEAALPRTPADVQEADAPFQEQEEVFTQFEHLSPAELNALMEKLKAQPTPADAP